MTAIEGDNDKGTEDVGEDTGGPNGPHKQPPLPQLVIASRMKRKRKMRVRIPYSVWGGKGVAR